MRILSIVLLLVLPPLSQAKNVVLFVGDGMGISTITAARIFAGQQRGRSGEEHQLSFDKFEHVALVKTYNTDAQVPDSAGTITAILSGRKTRMGVLGVNADVPRQDCAKALNNELPSIVELAEDAGLATGLVTTTRITHATPAGAYAHTPDRNWEDDSELPAAAAALGCRDIARQLVEFAHGNGIDVLFGGGRGNFLPDDTADPEYGDKNGRRQDGRNLIEEWQAAAANRHYVWNQQQFSALRAQPGHQWLGLFEPNHLQFEFDRKQDAAGEPSLRDMTRLAIQQLKHNKKGYLLLVEAGRIDHAHHFGNAYRALLDTVALDAAVAQAVSMVDLRNTLVLVTADHSHTLTISGYPRRGNPIMGKVEGPDPLGQTELPAYTTLGYANGPGYKDGYPDLEDVDTTDPNYRQIAAVPLPIETHGGEDVAAFATGFKAENVRGVMEQNELFDVLAAALFP